MHSKKLTVWYALNSVGRYHQYIEHNDRILNNFFFWLVVENYELVGMWQMDNLILTILI